jgi:uroporphyrin-III C-methyltransferase / precorrin-2 dehydrogenase / sirohydrochlorin ferrochelatase
MDFLPAFLNIKDKPCLVVGGGGVAARKARLLLKAGGQVTVLAPDLGSTMSQLAAQGKIVHRVQQLNADALGSFDLLNDYFLVIAATSDAAVNQQLYTAAQARGIPINVVDQPALCSFILPSIIERAPITVAVSSGGASPILARLLRARLEAFIPAAYGRLAALAGRFRAKVKQRFSRPEARRRFWEKVLQGPIAEMMMAGRDEAAHQALEAALDHTAPESLAYGEVYLVGAGPGDPDLLTFRALRLMQQADVVVYDRLVTPVILELVRREAERIYAGKSRDQHVLPQETINDLLVRLAREGKRVLRLKGGDPFVFGRGGEEIETLAASMIPFQIVPGITAANGCAAYAGIPLTHRDFAQSCIFVTGQLKDGSVDLNWPMLVQPRQTIVVYMGLLGVEVLCRELITHGMNAATPAALIEQGTTPHQRVLVGTLTTLPDIVKKAQARAPTLIIIGEVVQLHNKLAWFEPQ